MPNINDINGVTVANLAKLDAVLKANISKVNGLTLDAATGLLADYPGAAAAYSTRQLLSTVTVAMRIRRSGDDIEADVEFDSNNEISLTSPISNASSGTYTDLADFVDHSTTPRNAFCVEWKDQSGNGNDATQPTAGGSGLQPKLYDATTGLIAENGKAALQFDGSNDQLDFDATWDANFYYSAFAVRTGQSTTNSIFIGCPDTNTYYFDISTSSTTDFILQNGFNGLNQTNDWTLFRKNGAAAFSSAASRADFRAAFYDGNQVLESFLTNGNPYALQSFTSLRIGGYTSSGYNYDGTVQEFVMYQSTTSNQSSNASGIEGNMNSEYLIYQPTDAPTSGLLATYTGAAAAYSVRQLSDKAVIAMRIRRDSDDEERNIGFDSNGDLDTTAISDFCDTANGYVVEWADQSTNGNHATQSTVAFQPLIYNGTAVITINGKPGIQYAQSSSHVMASGSNIGISGTGDRTNLIVAECDNISGNTESTVLSYGGGSVGEAWQNTFEPWIRVGGGYQSFSGTTANNQHLLTTALWSGTNVTDSSMFVDGSAATAGAAASRTLNTTNSTVKIGGGASGGGNFSGTIQEILIWASDQSSNRTGIESNVNGYFSIY